MAIRGIELARFVNVLNVYCAPHLAEKWDNVGLLVEPSAPKFVKRVLVTNDLTEPVMNEAIEYKSDLIISYHPPIFAPLKSITQRHWKQRIIVRALENRIAIYSPHTGIDAKLDSLNDWLLQPFVNIDDNFGAFVIQADVKTLEGCGRLGRLTNSISLNEVIKKYKILFKQNLLTFGLGDRRTLEDRVHTIGVCAGSGGSILSQNPVVFAADLFVTGELSHHDRLELISRGISFILVGHSVTERGFFKEKFIVDFGTYLAQTLDSNSVKIKFSQLDDEPGQIV